ncbi:MAG: DUF4956 domain-containing protein [Ruminococcus sp.]|jgi:hypothetical protein|nr:DUF4956 domain-containing protein [Ruminococcus sp.]MBR4021401.1 DUF4956 domain-containing protein [Ruminococcus sp.]
MAKIDIFKNVLDRTADSPIEEVLQGTASTASSAIEVEPFFICVISSIILGVLTSLIYMITRRKEGYSQSYVMTMIMLPAIVALILLLINTTYGALSLAGAFTLVRFRSVPGDPRDIAYIFYSMATGVACGMGYIGFAVVFFLILGAILFITDTINFGGCKINHMTLKITIPENLDYKGVFDPVLSKYTTFYKLRRVKTTNFGTLFELIYSIDVKDEINQKQFIDELRALNGNLNINLVLFKYDDKIYEN